MRSFQPKINLHLFALYVSAETLNGEPMSCGSLTGSNDLLRLEDCYRENVTNVIVVPQRD